MSVLNKLRVCNWMLLVVTVAVLATSLQLEITSGANGLWVWLHIILGAVFFVLILWHLYLHYRWRNWLRLLWKHRSSNLKWLTATLVVTLFTALVATVGWLASPHHSHIGAVHGKFGFLAVALAAWHICRRIRFYRW